MGHTCMKRAQLRQGMAERVPGRRMRLDLQLRQPVDLRPQFVLDE